MPNWKTFHPVFVPPWAKKPWGTGHAVMLAEEEIDNGLQLSML
jgi:hypothetical protein